MKMNIPQFQQHILGWYRKNNRDYLPWRVTKQQRVSPYEIFVSEIMLQQTQVARVLEKYPQFFKAFPTLEHLAKAPLEKVLRVWQGMGYNRRARYLKEAAQEIVKKHGSIIPSDVAALHTLPGVGPYTAGAIACFAYNQPAVFLDTNIRKTFLAHFYSGKGGKFDKKIGDEELLRIAENVLHRKNPRQWHYALMDYGAAMFAREGGLLERAKNYHKQPRFAGSTRYWRSKIVKYLLEYGQASGEELQALVSGETRYNNGVIPDSIQPLLSSLTRDGLVEATSPGLYRIAQ